MKKTALIMGGVIAVLILFAVWLYLLIYGTPTKVTEYFTNFDLFGNSGGDTIIPNQIPTDTVPVTVDVQKDKLRQLTTRPVVGFGEFSTPNSTTTYMRYAEAGTGHIYQIDLTSGEEIRLSNVTVPNAESAAFSPSGTYVAIRSGFGTKNDMVLITLIPNADATGVTLTPRMTEFTWNNQNQLLYTEITSTGVTGRSLDPKTKGSSSIFTVPFQTATVVWSHSSTTPTYVYPKAASRLLGYLYEIKGGTIVRKPIDGPGLIVDANNAYILETELKETTPVSYAYEISTGKTTSLPLIMEPSKCVFSRQDHARLYCGYQLSSNYPETFPDDWYKGTMSFSDQIWAVDLRTQSAAQIVNPLLLSGREIDLMNMSISQDSKVLYFMNKNDNTLWLYAI